MSAASRVPALSWGCLAALAWGLTGTFIKLLPDFTTLEVLSIRILVALVITLAIFLIRPSLCSQSLIVLRRPIGILLASLMVFYYLFAVRAFQLAPVGDVALIVGLSPILGLTVKAVSGKALLRLEILGASIAFVGLTLFVLPKLHGVSGSVSGEHTASQSGYLAGLLFAFLAACVSLGYAALFKYYSVNRAALNPIAVSCTTFAIGSAVIAPVVIATSPSLLTKVMRPEALPIALSLGFISTVVPTFCYSYAAKHLPPVLTTSLNLLVPIFAAVLAFFLLKETMPPLSILGAGLTIIGIILLSVATPKMPAQSE
ncbi:MAG: DMT family transporter [Phormidesmis sp.]